MSEMMETDEQLENREGASENMKKNVFSASRTKISSRTARETLREVLMETGLVTILRALDFISPFAINFFRIA